MKSEAGRWYDPKAGQCVMEIPRKDGKGMKKPTIADAAANGWLPSVTTINNIKAKGAGLAKWIYGQYILAAATTPKTAVDKDGNTYELPEDQWIDAVCDAAEEEKAAAADEGKRFHATAQEYWKSGQIDNPDAAVQRFLANLHSFRLSMESQGWGGWTAEKAYISGMGYAGTPDLWATRGDELLVVDYKTVTSIAKYKKAGGMYDEWAMQIAAGIWGIEAYLDAEKAHGIELVVDRTSGDVVEEAWEREDIVRGYKMFTAAFELWKLSNRWDLRCGKQ